MAAVDHYTSCGFDFRAGIGIVKFSGKGWLEKFALSQFRQSWSLMTA
jgi:hypothetical protein